MSNTPSINSYLQGALLAQQQIAQFEQILAARQQRTQSTEMFGMQKEEMGRSAQRFKTEREAAGVNLTIARENLKKLQGMNRLFDDPKELDAAMGEALGPLGDLQGHEQSRILIAKRLAKEKRSFDPLDDAIAQIGTQRGIMLRAPVEKGDIIPDSVAGVKSATGFVRPIRDRAGKIERYDPVLPPAGFRFTTSTGQQAIIDDQGQIHLVTTTRTTQPARLPSSAAKPTDAPAPQAPPVEPPDSRAQGMPDLSVIPKLTSERAQVARQTSLEQIIPDIRKLPAERKAKLDLLMTIKADIAVLKDLVPRNGGSLGMASGRTAGAREALFGTKDDSRLGVNPEVSDMFATILSLQDTELRKRSGAQINEQEMKRLVRFTPDVNRRASVNLIRLQRMERELDNLIKSITGKSAEVIEEYDLSGKPVKR